MGRTGQSDVGRRRGSLTTRARVALLGLSHLPLQCGAGVSVKRSFVLSVSFLLALVAGTSQASVSQAEELVRDPALLGSVTSVDRAPVAGASVQVLQGASVVATTSTGLDGRYRIEVPDGTYTLSITPTDSALSAVRSVNVDLPRHWPMDFVVTPRSAGRVFLTGDVTLSTGQPVAGGTVLFAGAGNSITSTGYFVSPTATGTAGSWSLNTRAATGSTSSLVLMASGGPTATMTQDTYTDFVIPMTTSQIRVTDEQGNALPNAPIRLNSGGFGLAESRVDLLAQATAFRANWTATGRTDGNGVLSLPRPEVVDAIDVNVIVDPPNGSFLPKSIVARMPATSGNFTVALAARTVAPTPVPTVTASPGLVASPAPSPTPAGTSSPSPVATVSPTPTPINVTKTGTVSFSDGTRVPGAVVIPRDPAARVNGGNSADAQGRFVLKKPSGFAGNWSISCRSQGGSSVQDELCFSLTGGDVRPWTQDATVDLTIPMNLYRIRVVDQDGTPIPSVRLQASVRGSNAETSAQVAVLPGQAPFIGSWRGLDTTGSDGWAQVPGVTMLNDPTVQISIAADDASRFEGRTVDIAASELSDTVIALALKAPAISSVRPIRAAPGDTIIVTGSNLLGSTQVSIGGVSAEFRVLDNTRISIEVPSDAKRGVVQVIGGGTRVDSSDVVDVLPPPLQIGTDAFPQGRVGTAYDVTLQATGGVAPYRWRMYGTRPSGLSLSTQGQLAGTPLRTMTAIVSVAVSDATGRQVIRRIPITIEPRPMTQPAAVRIIGGRGSAQHISLSWQAPSDDGGNPITGYRIEGSTDGGATWQSIIDNTRSRATGRAFPYPAGTPTIFRVAAINALGAGPFLPEAVSAPLTAYGPPSAPSSVTATSGPARMTIQWTVPANDGGTPIRGYRIRISTDGASWSTAVSNTGSTEIQRTISVRGDRSYVVQVAALSAAGVGPYKTTESATFISR